MHTIVNDSKGSDLMAKVFYPKDSIFVPASCPPHPENTEYKVSYGEEDWNGTFVSVFKVQMVYDGEVLGRRSPSFPVGTDDYSRVHEAILELPKKCSRQCLEKCIKIYLSNLQ